MPVRCAAFTPLEICPTSPLGMMLLMLAVPNMAGWLAGHGLRGTWDRFEKRVNTTRLRSHTAGEREERSSLPMADDESYGLRRLAAPIQAAMPEWTFCSNGACESSIIRYDGRCCRWQGRFDVLNPRGTFHNLRHRDTAPLDIPSSAPGRRQPVDLFWKE